MAQKLGVPNIGLNVSRLHSQSIQSYLPSRQARTIQDLDIDKLKKNTYDGAALEPAYDAPVGPKPSFADASKQSYQGSCHCGKVTFALQSEPLNDLEVTDCNCNICARVSIFPGQASQRSYMLNVIEWVFVDLSIQRRRPASRRGKLTPPQPLL